MDVDALAAIVGADGVSTADADLRHYGDDWAHLAPPAPAAIVLPRSVDQVSALVRWAEATGTALVPSGGRTGLSGGALAARGEVVLSLERMRRILAVDAGEGTITVEAGVTTAAVQQAAHAHGLHYPVDFGSRGSSHIGGNIATNAGGIHVLRHGMTRDQVLGLRAVTGGGRVLDCNRGLLKNNTGYDFRHLFAGSEGTLGIIVEATLRLRPPPPPQQVALFALPALQALMPVFAAARDTLALGAFEFLTEPALQHVLARGGRRPFAAAAACYVLAEFDADEPAALRLFEALLARGLVADGVLASSQEQAAELWRLRESITESLAPRRPYKNDIAVRVARVPEFLARAGALFAAEYPDFEVIWFGHIGDGNLHVSVLPPVGMPHPDFVAACARVTARLADLLGEFGGTISAEHGVGLLKKPYLGCSREPAEIELMRGLKRVFDPAGIFNPGKIFD
ncbi:FAD-binding oxidoreductase [Arenimonas composti]|uniref:FAD-binding PCMH-type domain-containing protein n=1 Tax=Arenimonas composti TR7-09 = DSM 18010 TaxID=1121013 RepID=A0A091B8A9_9GAMM|nr:FAD-binding oxidoreductase [Arenimonas composti]KFN48883.1 hypothetical protein P873_13095 [Arenimonas composti TR7-09 = DSM 18010]